jgi:hypothetical protein
VMPNGKSRSVVRVESDGTQFRYDIANRGIDVGCGCAGFGGSVSVASREFHYTTAQPCSQFSCRALVAADTTLYRWRRGETSWTAVANLAAFGLHGVTRLAISRRGDRLALVASAT